MLHPVAPRAIALAIALCAAACERGAWSSRPRAPDVRLLQVPPPEPVATTEPAPAAPVANAAPNAPVADAAPTSPAPVPGAAVDPAGAARLLALNQLDAGADVVLDVAYGETSAIALRADIGADLGAEAVAVTPAVAQPSVLVLPVPVPIVASSPSVPSGSPSPVPAPTRPWGTQPPPPALPTTAGGLPGALPGAAGTNVPPSSAPLPSPAIPYGAPFPTGAPPLTAGDPGMLRGGS